MIVIFDEDRDDRYPYMTTWLGEHQNESDMAFYSTFPFDNMVGPGIGRGEYGGFLMTLPPRRMFDVWHDPDYDFAESKAERLLLAGLDYSIQRFVVYVAAKPPRSIFKTIAGRDRPHHRLHPDRPALAGGAEEDPRGARARRLRQAKDRQGISSGDCGGHHSTWIRSISPSSSITLTPSSFALSSFDPASSPATT